MGWVGFWLLVLGLPPGFLGPPGGLLGASGGAPGGLLGAASGFWAPFWRRGRFSSDFWSHFGVQKSLKLELKFASKWSTDSERIFGPSGGLWGSFGARFWAHVGVVLGLPIAVGNFSEN